MAAGIPVLRRPKRPVGGQGKLQSNCKRRGEEIAIKLQFEWQSKGGARDRHRYTHEPFEEDAPREFGYQGKATPQQIYRRGLKDLKAFDRLGPTEQDEKLRQIET